MRYWWVSQNQTYKQEISGGYMWSPKSGCNDTNVQSYLNMKEVALGDVIFSYYKGRLQNGRYCIWCCFQLNETRRVR